MIPNYFLLKHLNAAFHPHITTLTTALTFVPQSQRGNILLLSLIMLAALTMFGLSSLRGAISAQKISINIQDRHLAKEGAQSGSRFAEQQLKLFPPVSDAAFYDTLAGEPAPDSYSWRNASEVNNVSYSVDKGIWSLSQTPAPQYKIERYAALDYDLELGAGDTEQSRSIRSTTYYRILAYGQGKSSTSTAVVESIVVQQ